MAVGDIFQLTINWDVGGQVMANILHYVQDVYDGSMSRPDLCDNVSELLSDDIVSDMLTHMSTDLDYNGIECFVVNSDEDSGGFSINDTGDVAEELVSLRSAVVVAKKSAKRGRSFNGRIFFPPCTENQQNGGVLTAGIIAEYVVFTDAINTLSDGAGNVFRATVFSPTLSDPVAETWVENKVTLWDVRTTLGSVRRRQTVI